MHPFEATRNDTGRAQAAAILSRLLAELAHAGFLEGEPATLAGQLLARAWTGHADLLDGATEPAPHEVAIAAMALALAVRHQAQRQNETLQGVYFLALGVILDEIARHAASYPFHAVDLRLLDAAAATFSAPAEELRQSPIMDWHGL